jgi:hypothetical protein
MAGRRNWAVIEKFLVEAADGRTANGKPLGEILFVAEMFRVEREPEIARRRAVFVYRAVASEAREVNRPRDFAGPAGRYPFTGFQMMTFFVASSPGAGATLP